jgi:hypothetical protein
MADSDATRSARKRAHAAGDHSLCRPGRCGAGERVRVELARRVDELAEIDPQAELIALVRRLIVASEADPLNMALVRELRATLVALPQPGEEDPVSAAQARVAAIRAEYAERRANPAPAAGDGRLRLMPERADGPWHD